MPTASPHDTGYKLLFAHPEMVRDLLTGFMPGPWLAQADFASLERVNASYVSESERQRHDDMVWRLKVGQRWVWVYLLLEFQSEPDAWMALRMMVYMGLLGQHLVKEGELQEGKLPQMVPIVLYNGAPPWRAPTEVADCFAPSLPGLEPYRPRLLYHLVDEARLKLHPVGEVRNLAEALFQLERSRTPQDITAVLQALGSLLQADAMQGMRRAVNLWVRTLLRRKVPVATIEDLDRIHNFLEPDAMLEQTIERWFDEATRKGVSQGLQQGLHQGLQQGLAKAVALQLQLRFGPVPDWAQARLADATQEQLLAWTAAVLTAPSVEALFAADAGTS